MQYKNNKNKIPRVTSYTNNKIINSSLCNINLLKILKLYPSVHMEKIQFETEVEDIVIEAKFREVAAEKLLHLNIPPFVAGNLELARSEKEIDKCALKIEKEESKRMQVIERSKSAEKNKKSSKNTRSDKNYKKIFKKVQGKKKPNKK